MKKKKFIVIPDSFKGTMSSTTVCKTVESEIKKKFENATVISVPVADGGEGSVDCFLHALKGEKRTCKCYNPYFEEIEGYYALINGGKTAVIESAVAVGLPLVEDRKNVSLTSTFGVGQLISDALKTGVKEIIIGLGGVCTNDFACGALCALGVKFFKKSGEEFIPTGGTLVEVEKIDVSGLDKKLKGVEITLMCDVANVVYGKTGAAYVFSPQKGATPEEVELLDKGLKSLANVIKNQLNVDLSELKGGGAAGAMSAGFYAVLGAEIKSGINTVLDIIGFDEMVKDADYVITGEGKFDGQSLNGKVIDGITTRALKSKVPVIAIVGGIDGDVSEGYKKGLTAVFSINKMPEDFSVSKYKSVENLAFTVSNVLNLIKFTQKRQKR